MKELSLNILDIAQNSVAARASLIKIVIEENKRENRLFISIEDNGCGMDEEQVRNVENPFFTSRTTRKVGMGIPLFKMAAEQTGGSFSIESEKGKGTKTCAEFITDSIDFTPLGDVVSTVLMLVTMNQDIDFLYIHKVNEKEFQLDTRQLKEILSGVPLDSPEIRDWIRDYLKENLNEIRGVNI